MQLDQTRIVIRERDFPDILDLGLQVVRVYFTAWLITSLIGVLPFALFNWWLLRQFAPPNFEHVDRVNQLMYIYRMAILVVWELPLASAVTTRWLGHALFEQRPSARQIARDLKTSFPQLLVFQVLLRGPLILLPILSGWAFPLLIVWLLPFLGWPYLNEIILLERNPLLARRGQMTTWQRREVLHAGARNPLLARWVTSCVFAVPLVASFALSITFLRGLLTHHGAFDEMATTLAVPAAMWIVASFFAVVRYLSYLDLRIRQEGWEVELRVRAEADRLTRQPT